MPSFAKQIKSLLWQLGSALCCDVLVMSDFRQLKYLLFFVCRYHSIRKREIMNKQEKQKTKRMESLKCPVV